MNSECSTSTPMDPIPFPDPRDPSIRVGPQPAPPCTHDRARDAEREMHDERARLVEDISRTDPKNALRVLMDLYADGRYVLVAYDRLCEENGPQTMSRLLLEVLRESAGGR